MHELSLVAGMFEIIDEKARELAAEKVVAVTIKVGKLSGAVPDLLQTAFDAYKKGTLAEDAVLLVDTLPLKVKCGGCGEEFSPDKHVFICPGCSSLDLKILEGMDLFIEKIEFMV